MNSFWNAVVAVTALVAVVLSLVTIWLQRRGNRDQTFLRLHEILMTDDMRVGRALLIERGKTKELPDADTAEYRQMTHALGGLETAGIYIDNRLMSRKRFVAIWHHNLRAIHTGADLMARHRVEAFDGWAPWPHLRPLFDAAATCHDDKLVCCQHEGRWPRITRNTPPGLQGSAAAETAEPSSTEPVRPA